MTSFGRTTDEEKDRRLIDGLVRNDRESMVSIYADYSGIAYGLALRTLGRPSDAEDVVQESFIALWRQAQRLDAARGVRSYLLTIVHNKAIDRLRQRGRRAESDLAPALSVAASAGDPVEATTRALEADRVRAAMRDLPEEQRRTVEMTYFGGLTITQVATDMNVPIGTVKSRLRLAMGSLRRSLVEPA